MIKIIENKTQTKRIEPYYRLKFSYMIGDADGDTTEKIDIPLNNPYVERVVDVLNNCDTPKGHWGMILDSEHFTKLLNQGKMTQSDYNFCKVVVFGDDIDEHMEEFFSKERIEADKLKLLEITGDEKSYAYEFEEACITSIGHSFAVFEGIDLYYIDEYGVKHETKIVDD